MHLVCSPRLRHLSLLPHDNMEFDAYEKQPWGAGSKSPAPETEPEPAHSKNASIGVHVLYTPKEGVEPTVE
jgi:hypothetical protein